MTEARPSYPEEPDAQLRQLEHEAITAREAVVRYAGDTTLSNIPYIVDTIISTAEDCEDLYERMLLEKASQSANNPTR